VTITRAKAYEMGSKSPSSALSQASSMAKLLSLGAFDVVVTKNKIWRYCKNLYSATFHLSLLVRSARIAFNPNSRRIALHRPAGYAGV